MKTLIILILALLCQFANGQDIEKLIDDSLYYDIDHGKYHGKVLVKKYTETKVLKFLVSEYEEYLKECYADSTLYHSHNPSWNDLSCYRQTGNLAFGYSYELVCKNLDHFSYTHKEPDFPGFMKWLQNK